MRPAGGPGSCRCPRGFGRRLPLRFTPRSSSLCFGDNGPLGVSLVRAGLEQGVPCLSDPTVEQLTPFGQCNQLRVVRFLELGESVSCSSPVRGSARGEGVATGDLGEVLPREQVDASVFRASPDERGDRAPAHLASCMFEVSCQFGGSGETGVDFGR